MNRPLALRLSAVLGLLGVALGAFGAHGMKEVLARTGHAEEWETAAFYHLVHAVVLLILAGRETLSKAAWWLIFTGILLFSGSLYLYAATGVRWLAAITPLGGLGLLGGWLMLAIKPR